MSFHPQMKRMVEMLLVRLFHRYSSSVLVVTTEAADLFSELINHVRYPLYSCLARFGNLKLMLMARVEGDGKREERAREES